MLDNCFRFAPRDSIPGLIAKICKYLKDHPGWSEEELEDQIKKFINATGVESFNGRTGTVTLDKNDVNNLKIASAYFAEGDESIDSLDLVSLYNQGVRFVFTDFNSAASGYNLAFVLDYLSGSGDVVYYPMSTGSGGGGNIVSVNGKTGVVQLSLADIVGNSGVQVKLCTETEFTSATMATWNAYYNEGYRIVGVVNSNATAIDYIYLLKQDGNNHTPIGLSAGASDAYTPNNPPPYPVTSVNGKIGVVTGLYDQNNPPPYPVTKINGKTGDVSLKVVDVSSGESQDNNAYIFIDESENPINLFDIVYPVGSIYIGVNNVNPSTLFGGTWEQLKDRFLLGAGDNYTAGSTGGEAEHTIIANELPKIEGWIESGSGGSGTPTSPGNGAFRSASGVFKTERNCNYCYDNTGKNTWTPTDKDSWQQATMSFGNDQPHNNMPPYLVVYMWKRVA